MATLALSAIGRVAGAFLFGPIGAAVGGTVGGLLGMSVDAALIRSGHVSRGPRLTDLDVTTSTEGRAIPRIYGRVRLTGQLIWATRYEEDVTSSGGSKGLGGTRSETYTYYANFAVGLCEGPVARLGRVWADGVLLDLDTVTMRFHPGAEDQSPDGLILARQGTDAPAYRGLAYVVFERLPLEPFGNRIPTLAFELIRVVDTLETKVRGVTLIPGSTEFGYGTTAVTRTTAAGATATENRHVATAATDLGAALDELVDLAPNLKRIALIVAWFGSDLRAGHCELKPKVEAAAKTTAPASWSVAGLGRADAETVSLAGGVAAYGGTPSDLSVIEAIHAIRARGLEVTLAPFILMDVPAGNGLPDPHGGAEQAAYPWRGRITASIAPGRPGTPDKTAAAATEVAAFLGTAAAADFSIATGAVAYEGPVEWRYRRLVLHYAALATLAGGVDAFLIGSELRGLTTLRSGPSTYPFVAGLVTLAADVRAMLGPTTKLTYAADWTEWQGHRPADGSGDVYFHLDPLWSAPAIDVIGIDNYLPLADWRRGDHLDAPLADTPYDLDYLIGNLSAGEGYDWYYASPADRLAQRRTPIVDTARGEHWLFRPKDIAGWWTNLHHDRPGGVAAPTPTAWVPGMKPVWFTELGCPAVDLGANEPNLFPDPKSSEAGLPYFSNGARDDLMMRRALEATLRAYDPADARFVPALNPTSPVYGGRMIAADAIHLWTWDARPYPAFPGLASIWADAANFETGHWLNGRLGGSSVEALIRAILADAGFGEVAFQAVAGHVDGYLIDDRLSPRDALEPLAAAFQIEAVDAGTVVRFAGRRRLTALTLDEDDCLDAADAAVVEVRRTADAELPREVSLTFSDALADFRRTTLSARRLTGAAVRTSHADLAVVAPVAPMAALAGQWLEEVWAAREALRFTVGPDLAALEPGDIVDLTSRGVTRRIMIERIETGLARRVEARTIDPEIGISARTATRSRAATAPAVFGAPLVHLLDIPHADAGEDAFRPYVAAYADPWPGALAIFRDRGGTSFSAIGSIERRAILGETRTALAPGPTGRLDLATVLDVAVYGAGTLASVDDAALFAGANRAAVQASNGRWELLQFGRAELVAAGTWRLSRLLRAQAGSEDAWAGTMAAGAAFVLLDAAVTLLSVDRDDLGLPVTLKIGPATEDYTRPSYATLTLTPGGRGLLPLSPARLAARRDAATGDVVITWVRRSRAAGADAWAAVDVPLGEDAEAYRLEILDGDTVVRTFATTTPNATYSAAAQSADFGAPRPSYRVRVAQLSATAGAGTPRTATLSP